MPVLHAVINWLGAVGSGGETSPLAPASPYSEILRVLQLGIAAGVFYLIKQMREGHKGSDETHASILQDINEVKKLVADMRTERMSEINALQNELKDIRAQQ